MAEDALAIHVGREVRTDELRELLRHVAQHAKALRECGRRFERLPEAIVVDGGPEFESVYFETLLARYGCTKKTRPGGRPRFGSVCERLFGTTNTRFVHTLAGNTQSHKMAIGWLRDDSRLVNEEADPPSSVVDGRSDARHPTEAPDDLADARRWVDDA